jgi:hypothetical protein
MIDDQLPDDLAALFAAERAAPVAAGGAKAIVKAKLAASVAGIPLGAGATVLGAAGKLISVLALTIGIGAGAIAVTRSSGGESIDVPPAPRAEIAAPETVMRVEPDRSSEPTIASQSPSPVDRAARPAQRLAQVSRATVELPVPAPVDQPASSVAIAQAAPLPTEPVAVPTDLPPPDASAPPSPSPSVALPSASAPESLLLAQAWSALSGRDAARALALVRAGESAYPGGPLSEEREAIRISALSQLRRNEETRAAAARFLRNYPQSIHRAIVQRALEKAP